MTAPREEASSARSSRGQSEKADEGSGRGQMGYVTGYIGYISQIRWDLDSSGQHRASRPSPLGPGRQAVSN